MGHSRSTFRAQRILTSATMHPHSKSEYLVERMCDIEPIYRFEVDYVGAAFRYPSAVCGRLLEELRLAVAVG